MNDAAAIVRQFLSQEEAAAFAQAGEEQRAAYFFRAVSAMPAPNAACSMFGLYLIHVDVYSPGSDLAATYLENFGKLDRAKWKETNAYGRCQALTAVRQDVLNLAVKVLGSSSPEELRPVMERMSTGGEGSSPKRTVLESFGDAGLAKYQSAKSLEQQLSIFKAALLIQLSWTAAYLAL